ncbi:cAMP-binding domain of CRP or a regulatory subunit of cAMP-dependent protein kinases [Paenibacillus sp. UNCCL117]|uniref:Crp/Fnr family transcriptional regulator n=1 Tax=unclassified Paenibacillus TaxID=185978 RepID=UPI00088DB198|nr:MULTISPECIES: Crp/Fnr family transcriptional regulator [unclassified Paenibacillus]SDC14587.1 cAMP-binding domain of CRP or a regulatory subunit of cAMP-dependent protein kinases [Paenibacillus sp. cl123]SFW17339.1 cAMP-binding domain of CRP or a regulatory subunit of cAMP-dependent protein kinases [Paenibacillus sp. UNCCL117]
MILHKGEILFRQGETGPLFRLRSGLLKIIRVHEDGNALLVNMIVPGETIPHHSLLTPNPYYGTAVALVTCEIDVLPAADWYAQLEGDPARYRAIALQLQDKLRMMQQRIDQLTKTSPAEKLASLQRWFQTYIGANQLTDVLTQDEIGQFAGLRRETVNRLLRAHKEPAGPKNS